MWLVWQLHGLQCAILFYILVVVYSPRVIYVSVGLLELQLLSPHSRKEEREEKGQPLPFKVISQKYQITLPLIIGQNLVTWSQVTTRESQRCPLAGLLLSQINLGFVTEDEGVKECCDKQLDDSVPVSDILVVFSFYIWALWLPSTILYSHCTIQCFKKLFFLELRYSCGCQNTCSY